MMNRRFLFAAAAAMAFAAGATGTQAQEKIRVGYWTSGFSVGFGAVLEFGKFLEKQGLQPEWVRFSDVNGPTRALVTNSIDAAFGAPSTGAFSLAIQGAPVQLVLAAQIAEAVFVTREGSPIKSIEDFKGKRIGVSPVGSAAYALTAAVLERNFGIKPSEFTPVGGNEGQILQFLQRGDIDAAALRSVTIASVPDLKLNQLGRLVDEWKKMTKSNASPILATALVHPEFAKNHPETVTKYVRALMEATEFGRTNNAEAATFLGKAANLSKQSAASYAKLWSQIYTASLTPEDIATFKEMASIFRAGGTIKGEVPDSLFNASFFEKAKQAK